MLGPEEEAPKAAPAPSVPSVPVAPPATAPAPPTALPAFSGRDISMIPEEEADYEMVSPRQMFADTSNLIPGAFSMKGARLMISGKYFTQALPLAEQEAPLVDSLDEATGEGMGRSLGSRLGLRRARAAGTVTNIGNGFVEIKGDDGKKFREELHVYFPSARKTFSNDFPLVKVGDRVEAGQPVARSNYVTPEGDLALGRNLRVAFMAGPGGSTFEDAIAISESAAKKLSSTHLYGFGVEHRNGTQSRKDKFVQLFPKRFTKEQLDKLDDDGMARPGVRIEPGDPVALAFRPMALSTRDAALGNLSKVLRNSHLDETQIWEKSVPGSVADAVRTKNGIRVNVVAKVPAKVGDKLCLTPDHEVLTRNRGWIPIADVVPGDEVYSIDPGTETISVETVARTMEFDVDEDLYLLETTQISKMVTGNHNMVARRRRDSSYGLHPASELSGRRYHLKRNGSWSGRRVDQVTIDPVRVKLGGRGKGKGFGDSKSITMSGDFYMWLCGLYIAEGNLRSIPSKGDYGIEITQIKRSGIREIRNRFDAEGIKYSYSESRKKFLIMGVAIHSHFSMFGNRAWLKGIPADMFGRFSSEQWREFLSGAMLGDGSVSNSGAWIYHTTSERLAGDIQHACLLAGWSGTVRRSRVGVDFAPEGGMIGSRRIMARRDRYTVSIVKAKNEPTINHGHAKTQGGQTEGWVRYSGKVHCLEVPKNHTFYVRRDGKPCWTGNSARQGAKGVIGSVQSDSVMPVDKDGNPVEIVINPAALIGRVNPAMVFEALLGKVARRTGTRVVMEDRIGESTLEHVREQLAKHGIEANEPLVDPVSGRTIGNIMTGEQYFLKLEHMSEDKVGHRAEGAHDIDGQPAKGGKEGAKRLGGLINTALQGHGATEVLRDAHVYRGVDNPEVWRAIRSGRPLPPAKVPFAYRKFLNLMRGAGIAIRETPDRVSATAMTDRDVEDLGAREVMSGETIDDRTGEPVEGGLFDHGIFGGPEQTGWGKITLDEPVPNPIMEDSVRALLGITGTKLRNVVAGKDSLGGSTGPSAILKALEGIDLDRARTEALEAVRSARGTRRNEAIKRLRAVQGLRNAGLEAKDLMVTAIPVLPPAFRPAAKMGDVTIVSDSNYLYKDLLGARDAFRASRAILPDSELQDERLAVYDAVRAIQGVGAPIHQETRDKGVKGFMDMLTGAGKGPKMGYAQRKVFGHPVNAVGRAAIVPDARLDMDQVGIPEKMAWVSFEPFVMGLMVRDGMDARQAAKELAERTPTARRFLLEALKERPVMISRDPALHKFSIMGAEPVLVQGSAMRISPLVVGPFNADFDGDQMNMHIPVSTEAIREIREKMMPSKNLFSISGRKIHYKPSQEFILGIYNSTKPNPKKLQGGAPRRFGSMEEVLAAYRDKEIDIDTPVEIVQPGQATGSPA